MLKRIALLTGVASAALCASGFAQWIAYPTPGIPRTPDGKPNLSAPAPKTADGKPDLTGIWQTTSGKWLNNLAADGVDVPFTPESRAVFQARQEANGKGRPSERCLPHGVTDFNALATPNKFVQTPAVTIILFESYNHYRQIITDGRPLPKDTQPSWLGYSVGRWDGNTFVVDTSGFNDKTWLDDGGHPHSEKLHVTERYTRRDFGHMEVQMTIDDPVAYTKPWTVTIQKVLVPDTELIEGICENERDLAHMVGK